MQNELLLDYVSPLGPTVTHARGTVLVNSLENLRTMGLFDRYEALLPTKLHDPILYALASSWVPISLVVAHYETCDQLAISDVEVTRAGELTLKRLSDTFFGRAFRLARSGGIDAFPRIMAESDRFFDRLYQGGGCAAIRTGPKDLVIESRGIPFSSSRYYRAIYLSYFRMAAGLFCKTSFVKYTRPRTPDRDSVAIACSWV